MEPTITINYWAVLVCVLAGLLTGFLWFGPIFGKKWAAHMGMEDMAQPDGAQMGKSMAIFAIATFLIVYVLAHSIEVWQASSWGLSPDAEPYAYAILTALFTWVGFFVPLQLGRVAWEMKKWGLVAINAGYDLVRLTVFSFILAYWQ